MPEQLCAFILLCKILILITEPLFFPSYSLNLYFCCDKQKFRFFRIEAFFPAALKQFFSCLILNSSSLNMLISVEGDYKPQLFLTSSLHYNWTPLLTIAVVVIVSLSCRVSHEGYRWKREDWWQRIAAPTNGNVFLFQVVLLLLRDTRILIPKGMIACMPSLLSTLSSSSHKELSDCILIISLQCSTYSVVLPSVIPSTVFYNPCSFYLYPDCCCLYSEISCRAPGAFKTQTITSTCSLHWSFIFPLVQPWLYLFLSKEHPLAHRAGFLGEHADTTVQASLWTQGTSSQALQTGNTEFKTPLGAVAQVMQVNKMWSPHWPFYSKPFILQEMGGEGTKSSNWGFRFSFAQMSTSRSPKSVYLIWSLSMDCCRYLPN